ncbi:MAG TPA: hypothetical protein VM681_07080 [Candidatus Thermoplasmatota archaeon]|nr:hypothetical protein [Candidatus Thermoplasmatota archaeon]
MGQRNVGSLPALGLLFEDTPRTSVQFGLAVANAYALLEIG